MENQAKQRIRKSPEQQIQDARAALARAQQRQRANETRSKIVIGSLAQKWLIANPQAARAFAGYLRGIELREQDRDVVEDFVQELNLQAQPLTSPGGD